MSAAIFLNAWTTNSQTVLPNPQMIWNDHVCLWITVMCLAFCVATLILKDILK